MKKICLLALDLGFIRNIESSIDRTNYQIVKPNVLVNGFYNYFCQFNPEVCIIHSSYLNGNYQLLDMLTSNKKSVIIYSTNKLDYGNVFKLNNSINFYMLEDSRSSSINEVIDILGRDLNVFSQLDLELSKCKEKLLEDRLVRKAKVVLIRKGYSEEEAHSLIIKKAMQERISKLESAKKIIDTEEIERSFVGYDSKDKTNCEHS